MDKSHILGVLGVAEDAQPCPRISPAPPSPPLSPPPPLPVSIAPPQVLCSSSVFLVFFCLVYAFFFGRPKKEAMPFCFPPPPPFPLLPFAFPPFPGDAAVAFADDLRCTLLPSASSLVGDGRFLPATFDDDDDDDDEAEEEEEEAEEEARALVLGASTSSISHFSVVTMYPRSSTAMTVFFVRFHILPSGAGGCPSASFAAPIPSPSASSFMNELMLDFRCGWVLVGVLVMLVLLLIVVRFVCVCVCVCVEWGAH